MVEIDGDRISVKNGENVLERAQRPEWFADKF
jgi:hypothetical protein